MCMAADAVPSRPVGDIGPVKVPVLKDKQLQQRLRRRIDCHLTVSSARRGAAGPKLPRETALWEIAPSPRSSPAARSCRELILTPMSGPRGCPGRGSDWVPSSARRGSLHFGKSADGERVEGHGALLHEHAAIDDEARAGDVARVFRRQKYGGSGKILGRSQAAQRHHLSALGGLLLGKIVGANQPRHDGIDAHAIWREVKRHGPRHGLDAALGGIEYPDRVVWCYTQTLPCGRGSDWGCARHGERGPKSTFSSGRSTRRRCRDGPWWRRRSTY